MIVLRVRTAFGCLMSSKLHRGKKTPNTLGLNEKRQATRTGSTSSSPRAWDHELGLPISAPGLRVLARELQASGPRGRVHELGLPISAPGLRVLARELQASGPRGRVHELGLPIWGPLSQATSIETIYGTLTDKLFRESHVITVHRIP